MRMRIIALSGKPQGYRKNKKMDERGKWNGEIKCIGRTRWS